MTFDEEPEDTRIVEEDTSESEVGDEDQESDNEEGIEEDIISEEEAALIDGIGVDEDHGGGVEEQRDVQDPREIVIEDEQESLPSGKGKRVKPVTETQWLRDLFRYYSDKAKDRIDGKPRLYGEGQTFWFPRPSSYFLLQRAQPSPRTLYNPRFFLWDIETLVVVPCPKPNCGHPLRRHGQISYARRVTDFDEPFFIIGYRYRCPSCVDPVSGLRTVTFHSWSAEILKMLPPSLAAEFPAHMTRRSGVSKSLLSFLRSSLQNGISAKGFSDCVRVQHLLRYDQLQLQYYHNLVSRLKMDSWRGGKKYEAFLPYEDTSPNGMHGFVPNGTYLRELNTSVIEEHKDDIMQHTAMLPLDTGHADHSYKVSVHLLYSHHARVADWSYYQAVKHISRWHGEKIFPGLLTITNQNSEIRTCHLVMSTGHSQFALAIDGMSESLRMFGQIQPLAMYTDNALADRQLFERSFESALLKGVVPIEPYGHLEKLVIPSTVTVTVSRRESDIVAGCELILRDLQRLGSGEKLVVGFDSEWNVNFVANDRFRHYGPTAIVQLAYQNTVQIFQVRVIDLSSVGNLSQVLFNIRLVIS